MSKNDWLDLVIKGFGVCLLMFAIMAIPDLINGVLLLSFSGVFDAPEESTESMTHYYTLMRSNAISKGIGSVCKFIVYLLISINFLRSGSLIRMFIKKEDKATDN